MAADRATNAASDGLIWPKDGCASIASDATALGRLSSPGLATPRSKRAGTPVCPFLAQDKKVSPPPSSAALRPEDGCVGDRLRPADRHRGRDGRGLEQPRRTVMANIGTFKKSGQEFQGEIRTLS